MSIRAVVLCYTGLVLALPLFARDNSDVIVLDNGDRLTGEVKGLKAGVLYVSLDYIDGTIAVQWSKVARLESSQLFIVQAVDGTRYTGTLSTPATSGGNPVKILIAENAGTNVSLERSSIVVLGETSEKLWQRFDGEVTVGMIQSKGNDSVQFNLESQTAYRRERWGAAANFDTSVASNNGSSSATRNQISAGAYHFLGHDNYFYAVLGNISQGSVQKIAVQGGIGAGIGRFLKNTNRARISLLAGVVLQGTDYSSPAIPVDTQKVAAGLVAADISLFKFKKTYLSVRTSLFPVFSQPGRGRVFFNTHVSYYIKITSGLSWNASFYGNWDSAPPANFPGSDYGTSSGLSWSFGAR